MLYGLRLLLVVRQADYENLCATWQLVVKVVFYENHIEALLGSLTTGLHLYSHQIFLLFLKKLTNQTLLKRLFSHYLTARVMVHVNKQ